MRSGEGVSGNAQVTWEQVIVGQVTFEEQVTEWHVTGHVGGQVTSQVIGHVIEMDGWLVT